MNGASVVIVHDPRCAGYLRDSVDSALGQSYPHVEVIVVDGIPTDESRAILAGYGERIVVLPGPYESPACAWDAGLRRSRGEVLCFLPSDGRLHRTALARAVPPFEDPEVVRVHWPLWEVDAQNRKTGDVAPAEPLPEGYQRDAVLRDGPASTVSAPITGKTWSREFLHRNFPPPAEFAENVDLYLLTLAPIYGRSRKLWELGGYHRVYSEAERPRPPVHDDNRRTLEIFDQRCALLGRHLQAMGVAADPEIWKRQSEYRAWMVRLLRATETLSEHIPPGETFILVDEAQWGGQLFADRTNVPFTEREGQYWGPPADDAAAIAELERLRAQWEPRWLVLGWPAFWWRDHYPGFLGHLHAVEQNEDFALFDLGVSR